MKDLSQQIVYFSNSDQKERLVQMYITNILNRKEQKCYGWKKILEDIRYNNRILSEPKLGKSSAL
jgi:hypothetical protein